MTHWQLVVTIIKGFIRLKFGSLGLAVLTIGLGLGLVWLSGRIIYGWILERVADPLERGLIFVAIAIVVHAILSADSPSDCPTTIKNNDQDEP